MIDYAVLKVIWWLLIGLFLVGFALMDGFALGVGALLPFLGKTDLQRRCMINTIAPHWCGNLAWLLTGIGAIFAAWPLFYSAAFSSFYWILHLALFALILRPVAIEFRSKVPSQRWRSCWDSVLFAASLLAPLLFGVLIGNLLLGVPFHFDENMRPIYTGSFWTLLSPFALFYAVTTLTMFVVHGASWLVYKTEDTLQQRASIIAAVAATIAALLFIIGGIWAYVGIDGYVASLGLSPSGPANPLAKTVDIYSDGWFANFLRHPALFALPILSFVGETAVVVFARRHLGFSAMLSSGLAILCAVFTPPVAMFPFVLPSSTNPNMSLTIWDCCSSQLTLEITLLAVVILLPVVLGYTAWAYKVMHGKITDEYIRQNDLTLY